MMGHVADPFEQGEVGTGGDSDHFFYMDAYGDGGVSSAVHDFDRPACVCRLHL